MAEQAGLVSVVVIFLNAERFLEEAIASVMTQTYRDWELLLVDDGSSDSSTDIAVKHAAQLPERIRYLEHAGHANRGMSAARNLGIFAARGEFVAFLDADDVWLPNRLERGVALLRENPTADMVYGRSQYWYSWQGAGSLQSDRLQPHGFRASRVIEPPELLVRYLTHRAALPTPASFTVRRKAIVAMGGFEEAFRGLHEDQAFLAKFCLQRAVFVSEECWDRYRQHDESACAVAERQGEVLKASHQYLDWLQAYLDAQGFRDTEVWQALQSAWRAAREDRGSIRARLGRFVRRAAAMVGLSA